MQLEDESFLSSNHSNPMRQASREWKALARGNDAMRGHLFITLIIDIQCRTLMYLVKLTHNINSITVILIIIYNCTKINIPDSYIN